MGSEGTDLWATALGRTAPPRADDRRLDNDGWEALEDSVYTPPQDVRAKRLDIQGLRFVAVALVVLFHAGLTGALPGGYVGVDVFFVISGFLITGNITQGLAAGEFSLLGFYANRARRLLPAAFVTIAGTCLLTYLFLSATRFDSIARDALSSAYYAVNWRLSAQSVDYLAQDQAVSPFQHFWSLAVEEQFYLVWPLLLLFAALLWRANRRAAWLIALAAVLVPSLIYSITYTASDAAQAYFVTTTRMWELALGGGVALGATVLARVPGATAATLGWLGIAAILCSAVLYTAGTPFPGYAAVMPTVGAAAALAFGEAVRGPRVVLSLPPLVWVGDMSYSLYLWHWPIIVIAGAQFTEHPLAVGLVAAAFSVLPAWLSRRLIEEPGMRSETFSTTRAGLSLGLLTSLAGAVAAFLLLAFIPATHGSSVIVADNGQAVDVTGAKVKIGAEILAANPRGDKNGAPRDDFESINPDPINAKHDAPDGGNCITLILASADEQCEFGDVTSSTTIDLVGDSHAMQWLPALITSALAHHWRIITHTKQSCPLTATTIVGPNGPYTQCSAWNAAVTKTILQEKPALVLTSTSRDHQAFVDGEALNLAGSQAALMKGFAQSWTRLKENGVDVAVIAGTPIPNFDVPTCVSEFRHQLSRCARRRTEWMTATDAMERARRKVSGIGYINLNDAICPTDKCAAVIGNVLVYRDANHLSATYVSTLADRFDELVRPLVR